MQYQQEFTHFTKNIWFISRKEILLCGKVIL